MRSTAQEAQAARAALAAPAARGPVRSRAASAGSGPEPSVPVYRHRPPTTAVEGAPAIEGRAQAESRSTSSVRWMTCRQAVDGSSISSSSSRTIVCPMSSSG